VLSMCSGPVDFLANEAPVDQKSKAIGTGDLQEMRGRDSSGVAANIVVDINRQSGHDLSLLASSAMIETIWMQFCARMRSFELRPAAWAVTLELECLVSYVMDLLHICCCTFLAEMAD
jgi:hypothetical protein